MRIHVQRRYPGEIPVGALVMLPLGFVPLGAWAMSVVDRPASGCLMKMLWDVPCMTCGGTRATMALLRGEVWTALTFQPLVILGYGLILGWGSVSLWAFLTKRSLVLELSSKQDLGLKVLILSAPFLNWVYLYTMGI